MEYRDDGLRASMGGGGGVAVVGVTLHPAASELRRTETPNESERNLGLRVSKAFRSWSRERRAVTTHAKRATDVRDAMDVTSATEAANPNPATLQPPCCCGGIAGGGCSGGGGGAVTTGTTARPTEMGAVEVTATPRLLAMASAGLAANSLADNSTAAAVAAAESVKSGTVRTAVTRCEPFGTRSMRRHAGLRHPSSALRV